MFHSIFSIKPHASAFCIQQYKVQRVLLKGKLSIGLVSVFRYYKGLPAPREYYHMQSRCECCIYSAQYERNKLKVKATKVAANPDASLRYLALSSKKKRAIRRKRKKR